MLDDTKTGTGIAVKRKVSDFVDAYQRKLAEMTKAMNDFALAEQAIKSACCIDGAYKGSGFSTDPRVSIECMENTLLLSAWARVYSHLQIPILGTAKDKDAHKAFLAKPPAFTIENIAEAFGHYGMDPWGAICRGVAEVFCDLDPAYRSHSNVKFGVERLPKRAIIANVTTDFGDHRGYGNGQLNDLINAILIYRNKPRLEYSELFELVGTAYKKLGNRHQTADPSKTYWEGGYIRAFKNGTVHIHFNKSAQRDINKALAYFYGEVLPDAPEASPEKRKSTEVRTDLAFYRSTATVFSKLINSCGIRDNMKVLEPSAGDGALLDGIRSYAKQWGHSGIECLGYEYDKGRVQQCRMKGHNVLQANFLQVPPRPEYDLVMMNPPFSGKLYQQHIEHAKKFLKPNGYLISVVPSSAFYDHAYCEEWAYTDLPVGSFIESGTGIPTGYMVFSNGD